jgi:hypothetical protein
MLDDCRPVTGPFSHLAAIDRQLPSGKPQEGPVKDQAQGWSAVEDAQPVPILSASSERFLGHSLFAHY